MFRVPVVLVDNLQKDLDKLSQGFSLAGIPCLTVRWENSAELFGIEHIHIDAEHARVIALDINLTDLQNPDAPQVYSNIGSVLKKLNPQGPYCLIFWSHYSEMAEQIMTLLRERMGAEIKPPIAWGVLNKTDYMAGEDFISEPTPDKLLEIIRRAPILEPLIKWELRASVASAETLSELYALAKDGGSNGWNSIATQQNMINIVTHVAHETVGRTNSAAAHRIARRRDSRTTIPAAQRLYHRRGRPHYRGRTVVRIPRRHSAWNCGTLGERGKR